MKINSDKKSSCFSLNQNLDQSCDILPNVTINGLVRFFKTKHEDDFASYELTIMHDFEKGECFIVSQKIIEKDNITITLGE